MKDGALDRIEFMEVLGQELAAADVENMPEDVRISHEQRQAARAGGQD